MIRYDDALRVYRLSEDALKDDDAASFVFFIAYNGAVIWSPPDRAPRLHVGLEPALAREAIDRSPGALQPQRVSLEGAEEPRGLPGAGVEPGRVRRRAGEGVLARVAGPRGLEGDPRVLGEEALGYLPGAHERTD